MGEPLTLRPPAEKVTRCHEGTGAPAGGREIDARPVTFGFRATLMVTKTGLRGWRRRPMHEFFRIAIYTKNISALERVLRLLGALASIAGAILLWSHPWLSWIAVGSGVMLALTSVLGFCPACYFAGRKLASRVNQ
jgi:Protein of unknown function (DUF2892)